MKTPLSAIPSTATSAVPATTERKSTTQRKPARAHANTKPSQKASKGARIVALLQRPSGASLKTLMKVTGWQAHSVRAFVSAYVGKKLGLPVRSFEQAGERVYSIQK
jgi:Protein of unknown function (DUF3489)